MTVVVYKNGVMAADSASFTGGRIFVASHPKVVRAPSGAIAGAAGNVIDCVKFNAWFEDGANAREKPKFSGSGDDEIHVLMAMPDGRLWRGYAELDFHEVTSPYSVGELVAATFCDGAMLAGASAEDAVTLAIRHCIHIGGPVLSVSLGLSVSMVRTA